MTEQKKHKQNGLPANVDAERFVLGSIILDDSILPSIQEKIPHWDVFSIRNHQTIYRHILQMYERQEKIDRITLANDLQSSIELQTIGGLAYLNSLDDGLPHIPNVDSYVTILRKAHDKRRMVRLGENLQNRAMSGEESVGDLAAYFSGALLEMDGHKNGDSGLQNPLEIIEGYGGLNSFITHSVKMGMRFGFPKLETRVLGLQPKDTSVIGGITGSGKSTLALNMATHLAGGYNEDHTVYPGAYFSIEMSKELVLARMACSMARVRFRKYMNHDMSKEERDEITEAFALIAEMPIYIDDGVLTPTELSVRIAKAVARYGIKWFVLDYLQIVDWMGDRNFHFHSPYDAVTFISTLCKKLASRFGIHGILLSQLSRATDRKAAAQKPTLDRLRQSGQIEQDASWVVFVHREEMFLRDREDLKGLAEFVIPKNRHGSSRHDIPANFFGKYYLIQEKEADPPHAAVDGKSASSADDED